MLFRSLMGPEVALIDPGRETALAARDALASAGLLREGQMCIRDRSKSSLSATANLLTSATYGSAAVSSLKCIFWMSLSSLRRLSLIHIDVYKRQIDS